MRRLLLTVTVVLPGLIFTALPASAANAPAQIVSCAGFAGCFSPNPIRMTIGSTVSWTNTSTPPHTATADTGAWNTGTIASGGTSAAVSFNTVGTFAYHCAIHPTMHGSVIVTAAVVTTPAPSAASTPPTVNRLAQGGGGPLIPLGALAVLTGLLLLRLGRPSPRPSR
ncbi:MAG TPA: plastocyanin/azurin family copper-binding protein [Candidatus Dormibacteraeota bacterium]|jgi:plastocyanin